MRLSEIIGALEEMAPLRYAESWDNVGLIVGDRDADVRSVLVTVDYTEAVAEEARAAGVGLVVAYHPPLFAAVKRVPHESLWADAVRRGIALYSPHTALDVARDGTNDFLADACGVSAGARRPLREHVAKPGRTEPAGLGLGRVGPIPRAPRADVIARIKEALGLAYVLVSGPVDGDVTSVAVSAGAGGELLGDAIAAGAEIFVTGEIRHHDALTAARRGVTVVATLHSNSERAAVRSFADRLRARVAPLDVRSSVADADPFSVR